MFKKKLTVPPSVFAICVFAFCIGGGLWLKSSFFTRNRISKSVYFWKNTFNVTAEDSALLNQMGIDKIYCKLMDVDWSPVHHAYPASKTNIYKTTQLRQQFVPVVFITNRTMQYCTDNEVTELAQKLWSKITLLKKDYKIDEIQLDCDWTESTRKNYFNLIRALKEISATKVSVTIRLHQYKYRSKTGIPPADRGMLMCYNIDDIKNIKTENSIYAEKEAQKYFTVGTPYPLELDFALPSFSWGVLFSRGEFKAIIDELNNDTLDKRNYLTPLGDNRYQVTADIVLQRPEAFNDIYLRHGDIIRYENIDKESFISSASVARSALNSKTPAVAFFSYDTLTIKTLGLDAYEKVYSTFVW